MNGPAHMNGPGFSTGTDHVFSPAVRFAPKELSPSQAIRRIAYWAGIIAIAVMMGRSGFSHVCQVWSERPGYDSAR
jgi:hypothetical protein